MNNKQLKELTKIAHFMESVMKETESVYHYSVTDENGEHSHTTDRKGHIIGILEWALNQIVGNIDIEQTTN